MMIPETDHFREGAAAMPAGQDMANLAYRRSVARPARKFP
jgi:hypothetical protein